MSIKKANGIFMSFLLGGVIGSTIALLYAPKTGKHLRDDISTKTNKLIKQGKKKTIDTYKDAREIAGETIESANDFINNSLEKIGHNTDKVKEAFKSGFNVFNDERKSSKNQSVTSMDDVKNAEKIR